MHLNEVMRWLKQDYSLVKDCSVALNVPDDSLSQELVQLKNLVLQLEKEHTEQEDGDHTDGQVDKDGNLNEDGGIEEDGTNEEGSMIGRCEGDGNELGTDSKDEEMQETESSKHLDTMEQIDGEAEQVDGEAERAIGHSTSSGTDNVAGDVPDEVGVVHGMGVAQGARNASSALHEVVQDDASFPSGPASLRVCAEEIDLDCMMGPEEEDAVQDGPLLLLSSEITEETIVGGAQSLAIPVSRASEEGRAHSQSQAIPVARASVENDSVSDGAGSVGMTTSLTSSQGADTLSRENSFQGIFTVGDGVISSMESQGGVDKEGVAMRSRQMSLQAASLEEDVIAVPTITRSSSNSSSSSG